MTTVIKVCATLGLFWAAAGCGHEAAEKDRETSRLASEVDSFTPRIMPRADGAAQHALLELNRITRIYFEEAVAWANRQADCDGWCMALILSETLASSEERSLVEKRLEWARKGKPHARVGAFPPVPGWRGYAGAIESLVSRGKSHDGRFTLDEGPWRLAIKDSIFREIGPLDSPGSFLEVGSVLAVAMPPRGKDARGAVAEVSLIGSDKLGHFLATGFEYLEAYTETLAEIQAADRPHSDASARALFATLQRGILSEVTVLGGWTARVFSYADLAANYAGFLFYQEIMEGHSPYLSQDPRTGVWRLGNHPFLWETVMNPGWDEGINCSHYYASVLGRDDFQRKIVKSLVELGQAAERDLVCPVSTDACRAVWRFFSAHYGEEVARTLVSPQCREVARGTRLKVRFSKRDLNQDRVYYDHMGFYSGSAITRWAQEWCASLRDRLREARCDREEPRDLSREDCLAKMVRRDIETFRCAMDGTDLAGWAL